MLTATPLSLTMQARLYMAGRAGHAGIGAGAVLVSLPAPHAGTIGRKRPARRRTAPRVVYYPLAALRSQPHLSHLGPEVWDRITQAHGRDEVIVFALVSHETPGVRVLALRTPQESR